MGAAFEVHRRLGPGFREQLYERALAHEFRIRDIRAERQVRVGVSYKDKPIGFYNMDFVVEESIVVELKACSQLTNAHKVQARNYLAAAQLRLAILLNFGEPSLEYFRVVL
jgi:GxxExxY protein